MSPEEIFKTMQKLIAEQFALNPDEITMDSSFEEDLGADSVDLVELVMAMEEEWKEDIYGDVINIVYNKNLDSNQRILAFNKRIDIRVNDYTAYIINKAFK